MHHLQSLQAFYFVLEWIRDQAPRFPEFALRGDGFITLPSPLVKPW